MLFHLTMYVVVVMMMMTTAMALLLMMMISHSKGQNDCVNLQKTRFTFSV
jgi:hypothetical protein